MVIELKVFKCVSKWSIMTAHYQVINEMESKISEPVNTEYHMTNSQSLLSLFHLIKEMSGQLEGEAVPWWFNGLLGMWISCIHSINQPYFNYENSPQEVM